MLLNNILTHFLLFIICSETNRHLQHLGNTKTEHTKKADARHETMSLHPPIIIIAYL